MARLNRIRRIHNLRFLEFRATRKADAEDEVERFFLNRGYQVEKPRSLDFSFEGTRCSVRSLRGYKPNNGSPDFIVYKDKVKVTIPSINEELFFVEVKSESDAIKPNQLKWWVDHPDFPVYIAIVMNKHKEVVNHEENKSGKRSVDADVRQSSQINETVG